MNIQDLTQRVKEELPDAKILPSGEACNLHLTVVSAQFEGLSTLKRQQRILTTLHADIASGALHALTLKTFTEREWVEHSLSSAPSKAPH